MLGLNSKFSALKPCAGYASRWAALSIDEIGIEQEKK
jgi:hypothetical protein